MNIETANRLFEYRKKHGYSQEVLAEKLGISRQAVSKWERAEASPDTDNLIALSQLYSVTLDELLNHKPSEDFATSGSAEQSVVGESAPHNPVQSVGGESAPHNPEQSVGGQSESRGENVPQNNISDPSVKATVVDSQSTPIEVKSSGGISYTFSGAIPLLVSLLYLCLGFWFGLWHPGWLVFFFIPLYYGTVSAINNRKLSHFPYPVFVVLVYLFVSLTWGHWTQTWMMFITIPIFYIFVD